MVCYFSNTPDVPLVMLPLETPRPSGCWNRPTRGTLRTGKSLSLLGHHMGISLEFNDFVVPISLIWEKYSGGWEQCLADHREDIGGRVWYDEHLFRDGAMGVDDIEALIEE